MGAATITAGLIAGLYLRGLVLSYEAGWESTFLEPPHVKTLLDLLFGPVASWAGIPLPQTIEQVARLRWDGVAGGGAAAPWIHLIALCLTIIVVLPRLALAAVAWLAGRRLQLAGHLPAHVAAYARRALGADAHRVAGRVLLMNLASTPETENHGAAIVFARDHTRRARPEPRLLVVLEESAYAARFAAAASPAGRLEERRRLWQTFVAGYGVEVACTHDSGDAPQPGA